MAGEPACWPGGRVCGSIAGALILYAGDAPQPPGTNSLSFLAGRPLAGNAVVQLARNGTGTVNIQAVLPAGTTHVLLDVTGYFQ